MDIEVGDIIRLTELNTGVSPSPRCLRVVEVNSENYRAEFLVYDEWARRWQKRLNLSFAPKIEKIA